MRLCLKTGKFGTKVGFLDEFRSPHSGLQAQMGTSGLECDALGSHSLMIFVFII